MWKIGTATWIILSPEATGGDKEQGKAWVKFGLGFHLYKINILPTWKLYDSHTTMSSIIYR